MNWILIFYVIHWGEAVTSNSVRFNTQKACQEALTALHPSDLHDMVAGRIYVRAVCVEDKAELAKGSR